MNIGEVNIYYIYLAVAMPVLLALFLQKEGGRQSLAFLLSGMTVALLSGEMNAFLDVSLGMNPHESTIMLTPIVEELMKALPVMAFVLVFLPKDSAIISSALTCGVGFAILENCGYLLQNGADNLGFVLARGFSTGVMHGICTAFVGYGLSFVNKQKKIALPGIFAVLCAAITYHAIYNMLTGTSDWHRLVGFVLPVLTALILVGGRMIWRYGLRRKRKLNTGG